MNRRRIIDIKSDIDKTTPNKKPSNGSLTLHKNINVKNKKPLAFKSYKKSKKFGEANLYIIGTGGSARNLDIGKLINSNNGDGGRPYVLCLNRSFLYLIKQHNIIPDFNVTYDPHELVESVNIIKSEKDPSFLRKIKKINFILPKRGYSCDLYYGKKFRQAAQRGARQKMQWLCNRSKMFLFPENLELNTSKLTKSVKTYINGLENKLTFSGFPIADKLGFKKIYLIGADYNHTTGHWYRKDNDRTDFNFKRNGANHYINKKGGRQTLTMNRECLAFWKSYFEKKGGFIKSFVPSELTPMSDIVESLSISKKYIKK